MYLYSDNRSGTNLGVLIAVGLVKELTGRCSELLVNDLRVGLFGSSWGVGVPTTVPERGNLNIFVAHVSVGAKEIYEGQPGFVQCTKFLDNNPQYNLIHVGDIHQQFMVIKGDRAIINPGPMLRLTADASSFSHSPGFFVSFPEEVNNKVKLNLQFIRYASAQPGKQVLSRDHLLLEKNRNAFLADFVSGIKNSDGMNSTDFFLILKEVVEEAKASPEVRKIISELATKERVVR
jgi:hypothetical protein